MVTSDFNIDWPPIRIRKAKGKDKGKNNFLRLLVQFLGLLVVFLGMIVFILDRLGGSDRKGSRTPPTAPPASPVTVVVIHKPDEGGRVKPEVAVPSRQDTQTVGKVQEKLRAAEIARRELARSEERARQMREDCDKLRARQDALQEQLRQATVQLQKEQERRREAVSRSADRRDTTFGDIPGPPAEGGNPPAETAAKAEALVHARSRAIAAQHKVGTGQRMQTARGKESSPVWVAPARYRSRPSQYVRIEGDPSQVPASLRELAGLPPLPKP